MMAFPCYSVTIASTDHCTREVNSCLMKAGLLGVPPMPFR